MRTFTGKFPIKKIFHYMAAQFLGAFVGAVIVFGVYHEALFEFENAVDAGERVVASTAGIWATYPQYYLSIGGGFLDQAS